MLCLKLVVLQNKSINAGLKIIFSHKTIRISLQIQSCVTTECNLLRWLNSQNNKEIYSNNKENITLVSTLVAIVEKYTSLKQEDNID